MQRASRLPFTVTSGDGRRHGWRGIHAISAYQTQATKQQATTGAPGSAVSRRSPGAWALRSPQQLALDFAPAQVRSHGLRGRAHLSAGCAGPGRILPCPRFSGVGLPILGASSGEQLAFDGLRLRTCPKRCSMRWLAITGGARSDAQPALPEPNMIVQRRSNSHSHVSYFLAKPVHRGPTAREAPLRLFARISEFLPPSARR